MKLGTTDILFGAVAIFLLSKIIGKKPPTTNPPPGTNTGNTQLPPGGTTTTATNTVSTSAPWLSTIWAGTPNSTSNSTTASMTALCTGQSIELMTSLTTANRCTVATLQYMINTYCITTGTKLVVDGIYGNNTKAALTNIGITSDLTTVALINLKTAGQIAMAISFTTIPITPLQKLYFYFLKNL